MELKEGIYLGGDFISYCRFSDTSDVYCYCGSDYTIHLAMGVDRVINLVNEHDLEDSYYFESIEETSEKLKELKRLGLQVPDYAIEELEYEILEDKND